jgi:hypothetical protein
MIAREQSFFAQLLSILGRSGSEFQTSRPARVHTHAKSKSGVFWRYIRSILGRSSPEFAARRAPIEVTDWPQRVIGLVVGLSLLMAALGSVAIIAVTGFTANSPHHVPLTLILIASCVVQFSALFYITWRFFRSNSTLYSVQHLDRPGIRSRQEEFKRRIGDIQRVVEVGGISRPVIIEEFRPRGLRGAVRIRYTLKEYGSNIVLVESLTDQGVTMYAHGKKHKEVLTFDYVAVDGSKGKAKLRLEGDTLKGEFTNTTYKQSRSAFMKRVRHQFAW